MLNYLLYKGNVISVIIMAQTIIVWILQFNVISFHLKRETLQLSSKVDIYPEGTDTRSTNLSYQICLFFSSCLLYSLIKSYINNIESKWLKLWSSFHFTASLWHLLKRFLTVQISESQLYAVACFNYKFIFYIIVTY